METTYRFTRENLCRPGQWENQRLKRQFFSCGFACLASCEVTQPLKFAARKRRFIAVKKLVFFFAFTDSSSIQSCTIFSRSTTVSSFRSAWQNFFWKPAWILYFFAWYLEESAIAVYWMAKFPQSSFLRRCIWPLIGSVFWIFLESIEYVVIFVFTDTSFASYCIMFFVRSVFFELFVFVLCAQNQTNSSLAWFQLWQFDLLHNRSISNRSYVWTEIVLDAVFIDFLLVVFTKFSSNKFVNWSSERTGLSGQCRDRVSNFLL